MRLLLAGLLAAVAFTALAQDGIAGGGVLAEYFAKPDPSYTWTARARYRHDVCS